MTSRTLYRFVNDGKVPAYKLGRVIRLRTHEVDEFIASCRVRPGDLEHLVASTIEHSDEGE